MSTINGLTTEQTTQVSTDMFVMQTVGGVTKKIKSTNMKLVGYDDVPFIIDTIPNTGVSAPTISNFRGGITKTTFSGSGTQLHEIFGTLHIPHSYVPSTPISLHIHWSHVVSSPSGSVVWQLEYTIAKGFSSETFAATTTIALTQAAGAQYLHHIIESSDITSTSIEADSIILLRIFRDPAHASDTFTGDAYFLQADAHIKVDNRATNEKVRPFTKV
jgi:hypothetical protein